MLSKIFSPKRDDGFTLIELLVVVIIIGVLAAIALPIFIDQSKQAVDASVKSDVRNTVSNVNGWRASNLGLLPNSAEAYAATGGKLATSKDAYVNVAFATDGTYTVCGYNPGGAKYADHTHAWLFDSATGKFAAGIADCINAVHQRADASDTSGDNAASADVVTFPAYGSSSTGGTGTGSGTGSGTSTGSTTDSSTVIAYDPDGVKTITPGSGGNSGVTTGTPGGPAGTGRHPRTGTTPTGTPSGGSTSPTTSDPGTTPSASPSTTPSSTPSTTPSSGPSTTPVLASPGGTTLLPYAVGPGNPSCSYSAAPSIYSTFIDANCHKVHVTSVRTVSAFGNPQFGFVYNFDHDAACQADGVAAGKAESANTDSQGRPCDWLKIGNNNGYPSVNANYEQYYFDYGTQPASWIGSGGNPAEFPCAVPVYATNYQTYAFNVCLKDHGWYYDHDAVASGGN